MYTPNEVWICIDGYALTVQREWEQIRALSFTIAQYSYGGCKKKSPQQFWKLPWDKKETSRVQDILKQHALIKARREQLEKNAR